MSRVLDVHELAKTGSDELEEILECGDISKSIIMCNQKDKHSRTPLHLAAFAGEAGSVRTLLKFKAEVDAMAMDGFTALHFACQTGQADVVKLLIESKANINRCLFKSKRSPLHIACAKGHEDTIEVLIKKGIDTNLKTRQNQAAIDLITEPSSKDKFISLIELKAPGKRPAVDRATENLGPQEAKISKLAHDDD